METSDGYLRLTAMELRTNARDALDAVRRGTHVVVTRYKRTEAYIVPADWYEDAVRRMAQDE